MDVGPLKDVFEGSPWAIVVYDLEGRIVRTNRRADEVLEAGGFPPGRDLEGLHWSEAFPHLRGSDFDSAMTSVVGLDPGQHLTIPALRGRRSYRTRVSRLSDGVAAYFVPVDELGTSYRETRRARDERERTVRDFDAFRRSYPFGSIATFDEDHRYLSVAGAGWAELGIDPVELEGRTFGELWPAAVAEHLRELADVALDGRESMARIEYEGSIYEVWAGSLGRGDVRRGMFLSRDVTNEVQEARWRHLFAQAVDAAPVGVTIARVEPEEAPLIFASRGFERVTGYPPAEIIGRDCRFLQGPATDPEASRAIGEAIRAREPHVSTLLNYRKGGDTFWCRLVLAPIRMRGDDALYYIGIQEDVTQIREDALERDHLARLSHIGDFAGGVAHDLNNILLEITGWTELAREGDGADGALDGVEAATGRARTLVDHLLTYARRGTDRAAPDHPAARATVSELLGAVRRVVRTDVRIEFESETADPLTFAIQPVRLEQVLLNLVKNAAEAMPEGGTIRIVVTSCDDGERGEIRVSDDGVGMTPEVQERAFDRFFTTKGSQGTGLGLSSVRRIVEDADGDVSVTSSPEAGTTFTLRLPLATEVQPPSPTPSPDRDPHGDASRVDLTGVRVLVAEDDDGVREVVTRLLRKRGARVEAFADGGPALTAYLADPFDVVLTDRDMPRLNGIRLINLALAGAKRSGHPPGKFVLMSGDEQRPSGLPPDVVLVHKPFDFSDLIAALGRD